MVMDTGGTGFVITVVVFEGMDKSDVWFVACNVLKIGREWV
jgi:hypothetical protein